MGYKLDDLHGEARRQAEAQLGDRATVLVTKQERDREDALGKTPKVQKLHAPVYLRVTVYKTGGNWDADNREIKSIQDSIVKSGILEDDTIEEIPKVYKEGVRVKTKAEEKTVIEVIEL